EIALAVLAVAIGILQRLLHRLLGDADGVLAAAVEAAGLLEDLLVLGVGGDAPLHACHVMISLNASGPGSEAAAIGQKILDDLAGVRFGQNHHAARVTDELVAALD